jgi:GNAT superfamily N-acetyltransferase
MTAEPPPDAQRVQDYLRAVLEPKRRGVLAGAFVLYVHPSDRHPYHNYAIPLPGATQGDGRALIAAAHAHDLVPRLEYLEDCFPWVQRSLARDGFEVQGRLALMTCPPADLRSPELDVEIASVEPGSPLVGPMMAAQSAAFGEPPPSAASVAAWSLSGVAALRDGEIVGGAAFTEVIDGLSEIVGIGVLAAHRRRGIGAALTAAATRAAFDAGAQLALLTPGSDDTARVYERVGFARVATMMHLVAD